MDYKTDASADKAAFLNLPQAKESKNQQAEVRRSTNNITQ